jgi:LPXTG-motif cell wall-anchored protein
MRTKTRSASVLAVVLLLLAGSLLPAAAAGGNVSEGDLDGYDWCDKFEWKGEGYVLDGELAYVTITSGDVTGGTFTSTAPVSVVFVKGGPDNDGGTVYDPPVVAGSFSDDGLPDVGNDNVPGISNITFCGDEPELPDLELLKVWQGEDGTPLAPITDVRWEAEVLYGNGDPTGIEIGGTTVSDTGVFAEGRTRYQVVELLSEGYTEVTCSQATMARVNSAYAGDRYVSFEGTGLFRAPETDTLHVVCNTPDADLPELELLKVWQGEDDLPISPLTDIDWSAFVLYGNGDATDIEIGGTTVSDTGLFAAGRTRYEVVEPEDDAFVEVACSEATMARVEAAYADGREVSYAGTGVFAAPTEDTLHVICNEPAFYIDVDKVVTGDTAPTDGDFLVCVAQFEYREPTDGLLPSDNGGPGAPHDMRCESIEAGEVVRFGGLFPHEWLVWESEADPEPLSITYSGDGMAAPEGIDGVVVDITEGARTAAVTVTNRYPDIPRQPPSYFLDFEKTWTLDTVSGRLSDLTTDGYDAAFEVLGLDDVAVPVTIEDVTLSAGGQSVADGARRTVTLNTDYLLEESVPVLADDLLCTIVTTYSYDGEVLAADTDGDVVFTTPTFAANGTTFTIDVENEVVCDAVLPEVVETIEVVAAKDWVSVGVDGALTAIDGPADHTASFTVTLTDAEDAVVATATLDAGESMSFGDLEDGATYTVTWAEVDPLAVFELGEATCTYSSEASTASGSQTFVAGAVDTVTFTASNAYGCVEVQDAAITQPTTVLPQTGAPALWLTLLGLLGVGLGAGVLSRRHVPR